MSKKLLNHQELISIINQLYHYKDGYIKYQPGELEKFHKEKISLTYGEILPSSLMKIIQQLNIEANDIFYDLGSGVGKVPLQFFLTTPIKKSYGIEAFEPRHTIADNIYKSIKTKYEDLFNQDRELLSIKNNFLDHDLKNATIIFTDSLCFEEETIHLLSKKCNSLPNLKYLISLSKMKSNQLKLKEKLNLEFSWSNGNPTTKVYIYTNKKLN